MRLPFIDEWLIAFCLLVPCAMFGSALVSSGSHAHGASPESVAGELLQAVHGQRMLDSTRVMGYTTCQECHESEVSAWLQSSHAKKSLLMLTENPKAAMIAEKMGVSRVDITGHSICTNCHATPTIESGSVKFSTGVSCEMCHGASGPEGSNGWITVHSDYGDGVEDRHRETAVHRETRLKQVQQLGKKGSEDIYALAKKCYACHSVPNEQLVSAAGHPGLNSQFDFLQWSHGEVRHNFKLDYRQNAEASTLWLDPLWHGLGRSVAGRKRQMYVVGQLVELETSLRNRAAATVTGTFFTGAAGRVLVANSKLTRINSVVPIEEVQAALAEVFKVQSKLFLPPSTDQEALFEAAADAVSVAAKHFASNHDGGRLAALDVLIPTQVRGEVFQPQ